MHRSCSLALVLVLLLVQLPPLASAQSFTLPEETIFDPADYGLDADYREFPKLRTGKTLTFVRPNGQFTTVSEGHEIFTHDENGNMVPISEIGHKTPEGILFDRLPRDVHVTFDLAHPSYTYALGEHFFRLSYPGNAKATLEKDNVVSYRLSKHAVLRFTVEKSTIKKAITIDGPFDPSLLRFTVTQDPSLSQHATGTGITLQNKDEKIVFETRAPSLQDRNGKTLDHLITIESFGNGVYGYRYDTTGLPETYIIDPDTGYHDAGYGASVPMSPNPTGFSWTTPESIERSDNFYASTQVYGHSGILYDYLQASGFGFNIPDPDATIDGVTARVQWKQDNYGGPYGQYASFYADTEVKLLVDGVIAGSNRETGGYLPYDGTETYITYGAADDLWGNMLTTNQVNEFTGSFGISFQVICSGGECLEPTTLGYVNHMEMKVTGTLSQDFLDSDFYTEHSIVYGSPGGDLCYIPSGSLELTCTGACGWIGGCRHGVGAHLVDLPVGLSLTLANNESIDMMDPANQTTGRKLLRLKKGDVRLADFDLDFIQGDEECSINAVLGDTDTIEETYAHIFKQQGEDGNYFELANNSSGFTLYVPKSVDHDRVRVCASKQTLGCNSRDQWSFLANDQGQILANNLGFDTTGVQVSVVAGPYWKIQGLKRTGGEGEDSNGEEWGGGVGGYALPEFSAIGFLLVLVGCGYIMRKKILKN